MKKPLPFPSALIFVLVLVSNLARAEGVWKSEIPSQARESKRWIELEELLKKDGMPFGAMAAGTRMLALFGDLPTKESAYRAIIDLIDQGYPLSRVEMTSIFVAGDLDSHLDPHQDESFVNSYNLEKYLLNHDRGLERWAQQYYEKTSGEKLAKYQFFLAIEAYGNGKLEEAIEHLKNVLAADSPTSSAAGSVAFSIKAARTLARIYFEEKAYAKSLDIYRSFLLRLNPIEPTDWVEAAWNEYYLKHYPEALGLLYNLESRASGRVVSLEKYTLRALIYRDNCSVQNAQALIDAFNRDFGTALSALKEGASPRSIPILTEVQSGVASPFQHLLGQRSSLEKESTEIDRVVPLPSRELAHYLYESEIQLLRSEENSVLESAVDASARYLVVTAEEMKYLKYDVARQKFDPDRVFRDPANNSTSSANSPSSAEDQVRWAQFGNFWRNERLNYKGEITPQCD